MLAAVDVADMLVKRGVPFRAVARRSSRGSCATAVESGRALSQLTREELAEHSDVLDDDFYAVLSQGSWLESKESEGGTSLARVREQLAHAQAELDWTRRPGRCTRLLRPAGARGRARPAGLRGRARRHAPGVIVETEAYHSPSRPATRTSA